MNYIEKLITVDSVLNDNYKFLSKSISKKYDTPKLLEQKELIIEKLNNKNSLYTKYIYWILLFALLAVSFGVYQYYRKKLFSKRFRELVKKSTEQRISPEPVIEIKRETLSIPEEIANRIKGDLETFEKNHLYLNTAVNLSFLAKEFNTNTNYLSKTVNYYKAKNFSSYLNELRVNFAFEKLKTDLKFRKYTIKAIANDVGFKNSESFSKAFYKHYKIYPSFYIKSLNSLLQKQD